MSADIEPGNRAKYERENIIYSKTQMRPQGYNMYRTCSGENNSVGLASDKVKQQQPSSFVIVPISVRFSLYRNFFKQFSSTNYHNYRWFYANRNWHWPQLLHIPDIVTNCGRRHLRSETVPVSDNSGHKLLLIRNLVLKEWTEWQMRLY